MRFTDLFIRRPVLSLVVSLLIFLTGLRALFNLPIRQYPRTESATITVTTIYPGASSDLMQGLITLFPSDCHRGWRGIFDLRVNAREECDLRAVEAQRQLGSFHDRDHGESKRGQVSHPQRSI